jgi:hypothetical protein
MVTTYEIPDRSDSVDSELDPPPEDSPTTLHRYPPPPPPPAALLFDELNPPPPPAAMTRYSTSSGTETNPSTCPTVEARIGRRILPRLLRIVPPQMNE